MTANKPKNTDQDLLELAAKAAGINIFDWTPGGHPTANGSWDGIWNPLEDDGDALRLAVELDMIVTVNRVDARSEVCAGYSNENLVRVTVKHDSDPYSATRRAITRAAAEMGRVEP